ncbi:cobalamin-5'-phosphate synthase [Paenibacillus cellulosilyticus]|uniref:Adenosylcobinamide-GDP ribazoletransferase n=1 Tax=Paenibacillus cellulosilyticus TaxID=375489 RepID=A0A2V2YXY5_9BACL|nr:adenosylcobinamide-GDP ribazoletransferase [Paenibacillus cellulosilyticus]PWW06503.1 cobalamin-5'-phosphate synthase [Paenibacillus cellulosilyticus]QKS46158.1 adenosylcobinamide-GDP ribazoletransferase [Paenibacillus cellulosilyticus]
MVGRTLRNSMNGLVAAIQLLTRIPFPLQVPFDPPTLARSIISFPIAGLLIGVLMSGSAYLLDLLNMPLLAAALTLGWWIALTGGLHLDGWMDTADGVLSGRSRDRMLDIMKDSRVGAMGVIAAAVLLLVKFAALTTLFERADGSAVWIMLAVGPVWSRWWMTAAIAHWPNAREGGMGAMFRDAKLRHVAAALIVAIIITVLLFNCAGLDMSKVWIALIVIAASASIVGLVLAVWLNRKLGGLTGDTYGAMNEAAEAACLIALCVLGKLWLF